MRICDYIWENDIPTPVQLEIGLDKIVHDRTGRGNEARYLSVRINGKDVTRMVAEATGLRVSLAKDTLGCLIIHGCGMDMGFALQDRMYRAASQEGYPDMFDRGIYQYLGKRGRYGKYPYEK